MHTVSTSFVGARPGLSFRQCLLAAFLLITALLGGAAVHALLTLEQVAGQSREAARQAVSLTETAQHLAERTVAMERSARQYLVLDDRSFKTRFETAWAEAVAARRVLLESLPASSAPADDEWAQQAQAAQGLLEEVSDNEAALDSLTPIFARLHALTETMSADSRREVERRHEALLASIDQQGRWLSLVVPGAIALAALLAFGFGWWLSRPMRRIGQAINRLGDNRFDQPISVQGPTDLRLLGQQLDWLRQRLAALEDEQERFMRHVSHELKTPLAALREGVALLKDEVAGPLSGDQREVTHILSDNAGALQNQIEDLLRYKAASFQANRLQLAEVDVKALVQHGVEEQRLQCQARRLRVTVTGPKLMARIDTEKMLVVFSNLLTNALRFSAPAGSIRFMLAAMPGHWALDCIDDGPGVAQEDIARIFDPFFQGRHQPHGARHGSGIGLSIVREYVQAHGGRVRLMPSSAGAHFRIELPHEPPR